MEKEMVMVKEKEEEGESPTKREIRRGRKNTERPNIS